jgi:hypothetical protein
MKTPLKCLLFAAMLAAIAGKASAVPTLWITDGTAVNSFQIADGSAADSSSTAGVVTYIGSFGVWNVSVSTGLVGGTAEQPTIDLNSVDSSTGAGTLYIYYSANGFGPSSGSLNVAVGGTTTGSASFYTAVNSSDVLFSGTKITGQGPFVGPAFSGLAAGSVSFAAPYSLTELAVITHRSAGVTSFDMNAAVPDSGTTLMLLGAALTGLGLFGRSRKRTS